MVSNYMLGFRALGDQMFDEGFKKRFDELEKYVNDKLDMPDDTEITNMYVVVECE